MARTQRRNAEGALPQVEVRSMDLRDLVAGMAAYNPRKISEHDAAQLQQSLTEFGLVQPIVWNATTQRVVGGHQRLMALQRMGVQTPIPVTVVRLDETRERVLNLKLNRVHGEWDWAKLGTVLDEIEAAMPGSLADTGFSAKELQAMNEAGHLLELEIRRLRKDVVGMNAAPTQGKMFAADDEIPAPQEVVVSRPGDVWQLGDRHRVVCGDSTDDEVLGRALGDELVDLVVTSPPYNQKLNGFTATGKFAEAKGASSWAKRLANAYFDDIDEPEYRRRQVEQFTLLQRRMAATGAVFYNHKVRYREKLALHPLEWVKLFPFRLRQEIVWNRGGSVTLNARMFLPVDERIYWLTVSENFTFNDDTEVKSFGTVWAIAPRNDVSISAPFPRELPIRCIRAASARDDLVFEPYLGSGTTLIAAASLGRKFAGIEVFPPYVDVTLRRFAAEFGDTITLVADEGGAIQSPQPFDVIARQRAAKP